MKLRSITLNNVRRFTDVTRIDGIGDGLNLLCEPNEQGKSTLFDAIQALFFVAHGSQTREVKALRPHAGGAPEVTVEVEIDEDRFVIAKRWLSKPSVTVTQEGRLVAQADEAEAWIGRLLGGGDGGPSGLVWVRQGMTALGGGSKKDQEAALAARRDLMSSVGHEVEAMTGGRRMDDALARCRSELSDYATGTGRPRTGGSWKAAQERVEALEARHAELSATADMLHEALEMRKRRRRDLAELEAPEAAAARELRLKEAGEAHEAALRHAEAVEFAARKVEAARLAVANTQGRLETLRAVLAEHEAASAQTCEARSAAETAQGENATALAARDDAQAALDVALDRLKAAEVARRAAQRRKAAQDGATRRAELSDRIGKAEAARQAMEEAAAAALLGPDAKTLRNLEALASDVAAVRAARDAAATKIIVRYSEGRDGAIRLDGAPVPDSRLVSVPHRARLVIEGVGELEVSPGAAEQDGTSVETAERRLHDALDAAGAPDLATARLAAEARAEAERRRREAQAVFESLAPDGIDPLRAALAAIPEAAEDEGPDLPEAEAAVATAEEARIAAQSARDTAAERLSDARSALARAETAAAGAEDRLARASATLERQEGTMEDALATEFDRASTALRAAEAVHAEMTRSAPDLAAAEASLKRARSVAEEARSVVARLKPEIAMLDERISRGSGDAVEERLAEAAQELDAARVDLDRIEHEVAVLRRLETALEAAKTGARERYFAPIAAELKPLLRLLWPEADLTWGDETLLPDALVRKGRPEPLEILSGGTQEQVALLVRLAFARMLARAGRHAPVILDDALVFTDDDRIERMFDALHRQAGDLQILVLSCRQRAFRDLGGHVLRLTATGVEENAA
ncbi:DNA repair exonuclease SbcCD ATPase subunit [Tranquillimonas rosea]|uniref:DNA repair exonuclease SbcCD ATPase subunit n=1 Tax=Tranquillimonas rosea TaxID=641238 RepID=A0A1H9PI17_9RHOB|nr:AAA family ATPase [Tranquillimonas rosea]SER47818.1 DNA repair exonuclease SbcCD ATPase subunit [Tranquillimonas rosea]